jgi:RHS repeat-associated protein
MKRRSIEFYLAAVLCITSASACGRKEQAPQPEFTMYSGALTAATVHFDKKGYEGHLCLSGITNPAVDDCNIPADLSGRLADGSHTLYTYGSYDATGAWNPYMVTMTVSGGVINVPSNPHLNVVGDTLELQTAPLTVNIQDLNGYVTLDWVKTYSYPLPNPNNDPNHKNNEFTQRLLVARRNGIIHVDGRNLNPAAYVWQVGSPTDLLINAEPAPPTVTGGMLDSFSVDATGKLTARMKTFTIDYQNYGGGGFGIGVPYFGGGGVKTFKLLQGRLYWAYDYSSADPVRNNYYLSAAPDVVIDGSGTITFGAESAHFLRKIGTDAYALELGTVTAQAWNGYWYVPGLAFGANAPSFTPGPTCGALIDRQYGIYPDYVQRILVNAAGTCVPNPATFTTAHGTALTFGCSRAAQAPTNVSNLTALALAGGSIRLDWTASPQLAYLVERSLNGFTTTAVDSTGVPVGTGSFFDTNVQPGVTYYYRLRSVDGSNVSLPSAMVAIVASAVGNAMPSCSSSPNLAGCELLTPHLECIAESAAGALTAVFGYTNAAAVSINLPGTTANGFSPAPLNRGQPTYFTPGPQQHNVFGVPIEAGVDLVWQLGTKSVTAHAGDARCPTVPCGQASALPVGGGLCVPLASGELPLATDAIVATGPAGSITPGTIGGSPSVTDDGAFSYQIPLTLPPGRAGLEPHLALQYNSRSGSGDLGVGWGLQGLSEISRCPKTIAQNGATGPVRFDNALPPAGDALCLDGRQLVRVNQDQSGPPQFRTESDGFTLVKLLESDGTGPLKFEVRTRDGLIHTYGGSQGEARVEGQRATSSTPTTDTENFSITTTLADRVRLSWAITETRDRFFNTIAYFYYSANGNHDPAQPITGTPQRTLARIEYTGRKDQSLSAAHVIYFSYELRPDSRAHYVAGLKSNSDLRLTTVDVLTTSSGGFSGAGTRVRERVRTYKLQYSNDLSVSHRSLLTSLTECDAGADRRAATPPASAVCKKPTTFTYQPGDDQFDHVNTNVGDIDTDFFVSALHLADINGDGLDDLLYRRPRFLDNGTPIPPLFGDKSGDPAAAEWIFRLSRGDGTFGEEKHPPLPTGNRSKPQGVMSMVFEPGRVADLDMDGKADFLGYCGVNGCGASPSPSASGHWKTFYSHGSEDIPFAEVASEPTETDNGNKYVRYDNDPPLWVVDLNGDGYAEVLRPLFDQARANICSDGSFDCFQAVGVRRNNQGTLAPWEELRETQGPTTYLFPFRQTFTRGHWWATDVDGDGSVEFLASEPDPAHPNPDFISPVAVLPLLRALHLDGTGTVKGIATTMRWRLTSSPFNDLHHYFVDINGDGLADDLAMLSGDLNVNEPRLARPFLSINTGNGFAAVTEGLLENSATPLQGSLRRWNVAKDDAGANVQVVDIDQDGRQDILLLDDGGLNQETGAMARSQPVVYLARHGGPFTVPNAPPPLGGTAVPTVVDYGAYFTAKVLDGVPLSGKLINPYPESAVSQSPGSFRMARLGDIDGDGLEDIVQVEAAGAVRGLHVYRRHERADLLKKVEDGLGATAEPTYAALAEASRKKFDGQGHPIPADPEQLKYTRSAYCSYPQYCVNRDIVVVKKLELNKSITGRRTYRYEYEDGRVDLLGRGWLGFNTKRMIDVDTGVTQTEMFDNATRVGTAYPIAGLLTSRSIESLNGLIRNISTHAVEYQELTPVAGTFAAVPKVVTDIELQGHAALPGGVEFRRVTTTMSDFDTFGNARKQTTQTGSAAGLGEDTLVVDREFSNDVSQWLVGLLVSTKATSTGPNGESEPRTEEYLRDPSTGQPLTHTVEPRSSNSGPYRPEYLYTVFGRDSYGNVTSETSYDSAGMSRELVSTFDAGDATYPVQTRSKLGQVTRYAFVPAFGAIAAQQDSNGQLVKVQFDGFGRPRHAERPDGANFDVTYTSVAGGMQVRSIQQGGGESSVTMDQLGRVVTRSEKGFDGQPNIVHFDYESLGRNIYQVSRPRTEGAGTASPASYHKLELDKLGRTRFVRFADGTVREYQYDRLKVTLKDQKQHETAWDHDQLGRIVAKHQMFESRDIKTTNVYGAFSLLADIVDVQGNKTSITYDRAGRGTKVKDPDSGETQSAFNAFGDLVARTDARNVTTTRTYDDDGRVTTVSDQDGIDSIDWDRSRYGIGYVAGHLRVNKGVVNEPVSAAFKYTALSQLEASDWHIRGSDFQITRTYDEFGRLRDLAYPSVPGRATKVAVRHAYNGSDGSLYQVAPVDSPSTFYWREDDRDSLGRIKKETFGSGASTTTTWDPLREVPQRRIDTTSATGAVLQALAFDYDNNGNLSSRNDERAHIDETFEHDDIDRLWHWTYNVQGGGNFAFKYTYDDISNLTHRIAESGGGANHTFTYFNPNLGAGPHAIASSTLSAGQYEYEPNGTQTAAPGRTVAYTTFNLPKVLTTAGDRTEMGYEAGHRRAWKKHQNGDETIYVEGLYERRTEAGQTTHVFHIDGGKGRVAELEVKEGAADSLKYIHGTHLGSLDTVTNANGETPPLANDGTGHYRFDPWGRRIDPTNPNLAPPASGKIISSHLGFTGHEHDDELELVNMGGRIYDPQTTRFLTPDSIISDSTDSRALNRYAYALNRPLAFFDPTGHQPIRPPVPYTPPPPPQGKGEGPWRGGADEGPKTEGGPIILTGPEKGAKTGQPPQGQGFNQPKTNTADDNASKATKVASETKDGGAASNPTAIIEDPGPGAPARGGSHQGQGGSFLNPSFQNPWGVQGFYGERPVPHNICPTCTPMPPSLGWADVAIMGTVAGGVFGVPLALEATGLFPVAAAATPIIGTTPAGRSLAQAMADGLVRSSGKLFQVLSEMEQGFVAKAPRSMLEGLEVVGNATRAAGLENGNGTSTIGGSLILQNVGNITTTIAPTGVITVTRGADLLLQLVPK